MIQPIYSVRAKPPIERGMLCVLDLSPQPDKKSSTSGPKSGSKPSPDPTETESESQTAPRILEALAKSSEAERKSAASSRRMAEVPVSEPVNIPEEPPEKPAVMSDAPVAQDENGQDEVESEEGEWELVLGRRQIASWLFVGTLLIAMFSAASYYVGRMSAPNPLADLDGKSEAYVAPQPLVATIAPAGQDANPTANKGVTPASQATPGTSRETAAAPVSSVPGTIIREWNSPANSSGAGEPPLFANPQPGALYLQMGAVEKGIAVVLAEGLRRHGFNSLVAPGPSEKIFRVLIGPFATQEEFTRAKAEVDAIDLGTFARRFQN
jgi:cell division septation protein DedD